MILKLRHVYESGKILESLSKKQLPTKIAYRLSRIRAKVNSERETLVETRDALIRKYGVEDPETKITRVTPENDEAFNKEIKELLDTEIDLQNYNKIAIEDLVNEKGEPIFMEPELLPEWLFESREE